MQKFGLLLLLVLCFSFCKNKKPQKSTPTNTSSKPSTETPIIAPTDHFIKKYEGKIGEHPIELVLTNWGNGFLGGYYFYKKENQKPKKIELSGELNLNETFILDEYWKDNFTGRFKGSISELTNIKGVWNNADSSIALNYTLKEIPSDDKTGWTGAWFRNNAHSPGTLILGNVTEKTVDFALEVFNGGHTGLIEGTAHLNGGIATFKNALFGEDESCNLIFQKHDKQIRIVQNSSNWSCEFGMRANAEGKYDDHLQPEKLELPYGKPNNIFTNKNQHDIFAKLVGEDYENFAFNMQVIAVIPKNPQDDFDAKVIVGNVIGLATSNEAIIMHNEKNQIWAAVIVYDEMKDSFKVNYYTNDEKMKDNVPKTIEEWRAGFSEYEVAF